MDSRIKISKKISFLQNKNEKKFILSKSKNLRNKIMISFCRNKSWKLRKRNICIAEKCNKKMKISFL